MILLWFILAGATLTAIIWSGNKLFNAEEDFLGGTPDAMLDRYHAASPITLVTRKLPPTLLIYGSRDNCVESKYGAALRDRLMAVGSTVAFLEIPWANHAFDEVLSGPSNQLAMYHTERFLAWAIREK